MRLQTSVKEPLSDSDEKDTREDSEELLVKKLADEDIENKDLCWEKL